MSTPTPYLSALVLIGIAFPAQLFRVAGGGTTRPSARWFARLATPALLAVVAALATYVAPGEAPSPVPGAVWWYGVAVAAGLAAPVVEIGCGALAAVLRGRKVTAVAVHERWTDRSMVAVAAVVVVAIAEEVIFRGLGVRLLTDVHGWPVIAAVAVTAVVYGLNHLYFGPLTVVQKIVTGAGLGALHVACGGHVLVPVIAHVVQNVVVLTVLPRLAARR